MISDDKLIQIANKLFQRRYEQCMYPYQEQLFHTRNQDRIFNKSRQMGFSDGFACQHLLDSLLNNTVEIIVSPSQRQSNHLMDYAYIWLNLLRDDFTVKTVDESQTLLSFDAGGMFYSLPNSPSTVRGIKGDHITLDEFAHFKNKTDKEMKEAILPSISRGGNITYNSTPFGDQNLYHGSWVGNNNLLKILANWRECPDLTEEKVETIRKEIGEDAYLQEFENKFLSELEGQEFPMSLIGGCIDHELVYCDLNKDDEYYIGADIGRKRDLTACIALSKCGDTYTIHKAETFLDSPYDDQLNYFTYLLNNFTVHHFTIDESGIGNMLAEKLSQGRNIERVTFNNENKQEMVGNLKKLMQEGRLRFPDDPQLINSIRAIQRIYTPSNYLRFDSGRDSVIGHADLFWALALALYRCEESGFKVMFG